MQILKDMGITEYEPRVINQMLEFMYSKLDALHESTRNTTEISHHDIFLQYCTIRAC